MVIVKSSVIIQPMNPDVQNLQQKADRQILTIIPGGKNYKSSSTELYEDDQNSTAYQTTEFTKRKISSQQLNKKTLKVIIEPIQGHYDGMHEQQVFDIKLLNRSLPTNVKINGKNTEIASEYLNSELASLVHLPLQPVAQRIEVTIEFSTSFAEQNKLFNGNKDFLQRVATATETLKYASALTDWGGTLPNEVYMTGNIINLLQYHPENSLDYMCELNQFKSDMRDVLLKIPNVSQEKIKPLIEFLELKKK